MLRKILVPFTILAVLAAPAVAADVEGFHSTLKEVREAADKSDKPMYLHFTTTWCGWCRKIEQDTYASDTGKKALEDFVPASLDCTVPRGADPDDIDAATMANIELMKKLGGGGYPFLAMIAPGDVVLGTISGYVPPKPFAERLADGMQEWTQYQTFQEKKSDLEEGTYKRAELMLKAFDGIRFLDEKKEADRQKKLIQAALAMRKLDPNDEKEQRAKVALTLLQLRQQEVKHDGLAKLSEDQLHQEIRKFDPDNTQGILQRAMMGQAALHVQQARTSQDPQTQKSKLAKAEGILTDLTNKAKELNQEQTVWVFLGQVQLFQQKLDPALKNFRKALKADPDSPLAKKIENVISKLESAKSSG